MSHAATMELEEIVCPCGSTGTPTEAFRTVTRRYLACSSCGLVFLSPRPLPGKVEEYYRESYDGSYGAAESSADRRPVFASVLRHLSAFRRAPGRLLDIGCGDGAFMAICRDAGWTCTGVEVSQGAAARGRAKGLDVLLPDELDRAGVPPFDVVTLVNVLETVTDPTMVIQAVARSVAQQGLIAIRVSNGTFHQWIRKPARWFGAQYDQAFHLFCYTPSALRVLLEANGFEVLSMRNSAPSLGPVTEATSIGRRIKWRLLGGLFSFAAAVAYGVSGGRLIWAPSIELVARPSSGTR
ncbi:MAG: class I SAM-dependent methyltransferase [Nitrospira sp.]